MLFSDLASSIKSRTVETARIERESRFNNKFEKAQNQVKLQKARAEETNANWQTAQDEVQPLKQEVAELQAKLIEEIDRRKDLEAELQS